MGDFRAPNRLVADGEQLVVQKFPNGSVGFVSAIGVSRIELTQIAAPKGSLWQRLKRLLRDGPGGSLPLSEVLVPSGTYLILRDIPSSIQQTYGLRDEEGAVLEGSPAETPCPGMLRFNNGAQIRMQELRGQLVEVLSLAKTRPILYERELLPL
jgi:hypothetical protein